MLLQPHKPALANAIWAMTMESSDVTAPQGELQFVLDGVALIHRILGREGVLEVYVRYTAIMWTRSMEKQSLSLMDTQEHPQRHDTGKTYRRESSCNCHIY